MFWTQELLTLLEFGRPGQRSRKRSIGSDRCFNLTLKMTFDRLGCLLDTKGDFGSGCLLDSEGDFHSGFWNINHYQQSFSALSHGNQISGKIVTWPQYLPKMFETSEGKGWLGAWICKGSLNTDKMNYGDQLKNKQSAMLAKGRHPTLATTPHHVTYALREICWSQLKTQNSN